MKNLPLHFATSHVVFFNVCFDIKKSKYPLKDQMDLFSFTPLLIYRADEDRSGNDEACISNSSFPQVSRNTTKEGPNIKARKLEESSEMLSSRHSMAVVYRNSFQRGYLQETHKTSSQLKLQPLIE